MDSETIIAQDWSEECGDYRVTQEWLRKENGVLFLVEEVVEKVPHKFKRITTGPAGPWGPAEYDDECVFCGAIRGVEGTE